MVEYKIRRYKNYGIISPVPDGRLASTLERLMSYKRQGAEFMPHPEWAIVRLYNKKKGTFPWGMQKLVEKIFNKWCAVEKDDDNFDILEPFYHNTGVMAKSAARMLEDNILRIYQIKAVQELLFNNGGVLCMPTGSGKTKTIIEWLKILNLPAVVIVPTLDIKTQWQKQVTGTKIMIENYQSKNAEHLIEESKVIVFDECHHVAAKTIYKLAMMAGTDTIIAGCSATPKRDDGEDMRIQGAIGEIVYQISRRELIEQGFLSDAKVKYFKPSFDTTQDKFMSYAEIYKKHIVDNYTRNNMIISLAEEYVEQGKKILILVSHIEHGEYLYNQICCLRHNKIFLHGGSKKEQRQQDLSNFNIIVASNIFNEGVDLPALDVIILAAGGKSSIQLTQRIGRVLRPSKDKEYALIIDFKDETRYLKEHYLRRRAILEEDFKVEDII